MWSSTPEAADPVPGDAAGKVAAVAVALGSEHRSVEAAEVTIWLPPAIEAVHPGALPY